MDGNNINNIIHQNKIEEIIIDKSKLYNVLGPSIKRKESSDMKMNNSYKFGFQSKIWAIGNLLDI